MTNGRPPVLIIGLDGASPDLLRRWTDSGDLPALRGLAERGSFGPLRSTVPPISPAAWSTFMTGRNPAAHGVLGFRNLDARRYEYHESDIVSSGPVAGETFWDFAGASGRRVGVFWVPVTYPPWAVNGVLVCGYPTPDSSRSFGFPESQVSGAPGLTENSAFFSSARPDQLAAELVRLARDRGRAAAEWIRREAFDLSVAVLGSIDRAQHDFWRHHDPLSPAHDPGEAERFGSVVLDTYRASDAAVANMVAAAPADSIVFIVSDHGGGPAAGRLVHLNAWLRGEGWLCAHPPRRRSVGRTIYSWLKDRFAAKEMLFRRLPPSWRRRLTLFDAAATFDLLSVQWPRTRAYRFPLYPPFEGIVINLAGRQPQGCIGAGEYESLRGRIAESLWTLRDPLDDRPIVARVFRREEVYAGAHLERLPDLIVEWHTGYAGGPGIWSDPVTPVPANDLRKHSGSHRMDGVLVAAGPTLRRGAAITGATLADVAPTILYALGLPCPATMDGRVLTELFEADHARNHPARKADLSFPGARPTQPGFSPDEQAEIIERLRALGYID